MTSERDDCPAVISAFKDWAVKVLTDNEIDEYFIAMRRSTRRIGRVIPKKKKITFSSYYVMFDYLSAKKAFLHEVAHVLDLKWYGYSAHGKRFCEIAESIGGFTGKTVPGTGFGAYACKYRLKCSYCGTASYIDRATMDRSCAICSPGAFDRQYTLVPEPNPERFKFKEIHE